VHVLKKKGINMNWNEDLIASVRPAIDQVFRVILDDSCERFKAEAAQTIKDALGALDNTLKSKYNMLWRSQLTDYSSEDPQALACDAYKMCFSENRSHFEEGISRQVEVSTKALREGLM
jgi:hypothetical protein